MHTHTHTSTRTAVVLTSVASFAVVSKSTGLTSSALRVHGSELLWIPIGDRPINLERYFSSGRDERWPQQVTLTIPIFMIYLMTISRILLFRALY